MENIKVISNQKIIKYLLTIFLGSLLLTISAKIKIPFYPVPMTMQTFVVVLMGVTFGWKIGVATISLYLLEGIIGFPVFAGTPEKGLGLVYFMGPTMGYLIGFLSAGFLASLINLTFSSKYRWPSILAKSASKAVALLPSKKPWATSAR